MLRFTFLQPNEVPLAPEHRALYSTIRDVVKWEITDETGDYSGLLIAGEQIVGIHPPSKGFVPSANMTTKFDGRELYTGEDSRALPSCKKRILRPTCWLSRDRWEPSDPVIYRRAPTHNRQVSGRKRSRAAKAHLTSGAKDLPLPTPPSLSDSPNPSSPAPPLDPSCMTPPNSPTRSATSATDLRMSPSGTSEPDPQKSSPNADLSSLCSSHP